MRGRARGDGGVRRHKGTQDINDKLRNAIMTLCMVLVIAAMLFFTVKKFRHDREQAKIKAGQERKDPMLKYIDKMPSISDRYKEKK